MQQYNETSKKLQFYYLSFIRRPITIHIWAEPINFIVNASIAAIGYDSTTIWMAVLQKTAQPQLECYTRRKLWSCRNWYLEQKFQYKFSIIGNWWLCNVRLRQMVQI